ncbi:MAG: hypothetical protein GY757_16810 [bacterium]|nr:hypothetical protein [bacterium]
MEQLEVISWKTLDALKQAATNIEDVIGDLDTNEQMAVFCSIDEDYLELYYTEMEGNYIRHFEDEDEMIQYINRRKNEFGEDDYDSVEFYGDGMDYDDQGTSTDFTGYKIGDEEEGDDY